MTSRDILNRAILRVLNKDIRLSGPEEEIDLEGREEEMAEAVKYYTRAGPSLLVESIPPKDYTSLETRNQIAHSLRNCKTIGDMENYC